MDVKGQTKQYRVISHKLSLLMWVVACGVIVWGLYVVISIVNRRPDLWYFLFMVPVELYVMISLYFIIDRFRLFISPDGIRFQFWAYDVSSTWKNVERMEKGIWQNRLVLKQPLVEKWKYAWMILFPSNFQARYIPFGRFTWSRFREVENEVRKYAPHLFI